MSVNQKKPHIFKFLTLSTLATLMSVVFVFIGAPLLRVLRNQYGSRNYWAFGISVFFLITLTGFFHLAFLCSSVWLVIGLYSELEERGHAHFWSALAVIILSTLFVVVGPMIWAQSLGMDLQAVLQEAIDQFFQKVGQNQSPENATLMSGIKFDSKFIMSQIPSIMFLLHLISLAFALMMDRKTAVMFGLKFEKIASQIRLLEFRVPDLFIWITMLSFLMSFIKIGNDNITLLSMNIFNSLMGLYFFQGLAVLEVFLLVFRAGTLTRILVYFILVGQFFFILSLVGIIDFWADFRKRLRSGKFKQNNQNSGEQV